MGEGSTHDLYRLDLSSRTWSQVAAKGTPPEPRSFHAMVAVKGKLYVFGGCGVSGRLSDLHSFDCEDGSWGQLPSSEAIKVTHQTTVFEMCYSVLQCIARLSLTSRISAATNFQHACALMS